MIIDFHTHIFPKFVRKNREEFCKKDPYFRLLYKSKKGKCLPKMVGASELVSAMDQAGVEKSVVCGFTWSDYKLCQESNDYLLESINRFPERLIGFAAVHLKDTEKSISEIERCVKRGMKGVGELTPEAQRVSLDDQESIKPIMELIKKLKATLLIHTNETVGHSYPGKGKTDLRKFYDFIVAYPEVTIVLAHWGGGLFFYELMPEVAKVVKHVYYDTAASPFIYLPKIYSIALQIIGSDKILFATDFPLIDQKRYINEIESMGISKEDRKKIYGGNAKKLLNL
jgi:hypothetical protein